MTVPAVLRLGTRKSPMAMAQSGLVAEAITARTGYRVELVGVTTHGDVSQAHIAQIGGTGVFVGALRDGLLARLAASITLCATAAAWLSGASATGFLSRMKARVAALR